MQEPKGIGQVLRAAHGLPTEPRSYRSDGSGGAVTVTPNSAATYAANSSLVGRHPSQNPTDSAAMTPWRWRGLRVRSTTSYRSAMLGDRLTLCRNVAVLPGSPAGAWLERRGRANVAASPKGHAGRLRSCCHYRRSFPW